MVRRVTLWFFLLSLCLVAAGVPTPKEHFGFSPGDDYKLADYGEIISYYQKLSTSSDRIHFEEFGKSAMGKPMYIAFISAAANLKKLDHYREISRKMALGIPSPEEARLLAEEGKAVVWIDSGLHSSEVAPAQHSPELAYRMLTGESEEVKRIRRNVILLQVPVINPDGHEMIVHWYRKNLGSMYELAPLPMLYQKYAGHDNNRDWFMMNLRETRNVSRLLFEEWFPQIVYNQHQAPAFPARIFVPPYAEPLNPNIPAAVMEGINLIGAAMKERFARENKPGVLSYYGFDAWWNGGLRSVPAFHNMHGILTETALHSYGTPKEYNSADFPERFPNGIPTREPTVFYQRPWMGGKWGTREAVEYMLTADFAILDLAASRSSSFLHKAYELARANIEAGKRDRPYAYIVPDKQWDRSGALEMLRRLSWGGIQIHRATAPFTAGADSYPAGTWVILAGQPFRGYLIDLLEPQKYPEIRIGTSGPTKRPYDVAGWTLSMMMGVEVNRSEDAFRAELEEVSEIPEWQPSLDHRENSSYITIAGMLERGEKVRWSADGGILKQEAAGFESAAFELHRPRVALYEPWTANMDTGWTQWVLDRFKIPYALVHNEDFEKGDLRSRFDSIILASQSAESILHGFRNGELTSRSGSPATQVKAIQRPEYTGGIGIAGLASLEAFVRDGGTLIALDNAAELPVRFFPLPVRGLIGSAADSKTNGEAGSYYSPGSLLRIDVDNKHPIAFGMPREAYAFSNGGQAYEITLLPEFNKGDRRVRSVASYAKEKLLASGWISGEKAVLGKSILVEARHGKGRVVAMGFRPQFRGQSFGTFKFLLNAIYLGSAREL
ncbi:MAG: M14 family zinc carboxypeptidase [Bryobacteraceae bacterium]